MDNLPEKKDEQISSLGSAGSVGAGNVGGSEGVESAAPVYSVSELEPIDTPVTSKTRTAAKKILPSSMLIFILVITFLSVVVFAVFYIKSNYFEEPVEEGPDETPSTTDSSLIYIEDDQSFIYAPGFDEKQWPSRIIQGTVTSYETEGSKTFIAINSDNMLYKFLLTDTSKTGLEKVLYSGESGNAIYDSSVIKDALPVGIKITVEYVTSSPTKFARTSERCKDNQRLCSFADYYESTGVKFDSDTHLNAGIVPVYSISDEVFLEEFND